MILIMIDDKLSSKYVPQRLTFSSTDLIFLLLYNLLLIDKFIHSSKMLLMPIIDGLWVKLPYIELL